MNRKITVIVALFAMVFWIGTAFGEQQPPIEVKIPKPAVDLSTNYSSTTIFESTGDRQIALASSTTSPEVDITVIPVLLPAQNTTVFWPVAKKLVNDRKVYRWTSDSGYMLCRGQVLPMNLVYSKTNDTPWVVLQQLIDVRSVDGEDTIDLAGINITAESVPGVLNTSYGVDGRGYGDAAIGIRNDGSVVTTGSPSQKVARVIFITQLKLFVDKLSTVENWVNAQDNFTIRYAVKYGESSYIGKGVVSIYGYTLQPMLVVRRHEGYTMFGVVGGDEYRPHFLQSSATVDGPYITVDRPVYSGDMLPTGEIGSGNKFFRLVGTDW
jgi:hypothetical protein